MADIPESTKMDAVDILKTYAEFIRNDVRADDFERHPYLPHIEQTIENLRAAPPAMDREVIADIIAGNVSGPDIHRLGIDPALHREDQLRAADLILSTLSADAIRQGEGWQDIGCAPKDGTDILAWSEEYGVRQTRMGRYTPGSPGFAAWERGDGPLNHGWVWIEEKHNSAHSWKPTHWMPLPATPASHASDGGKA